MKRVALFAMVVLVLSGILSAQESQLSLDRLRPRDFQAALSGSAEQFENLMRLVDETLAKDPKDGFAWVMHGMGSLRRSGEVSAAGDREASARLFQSGIAEMEKGVQLAPENPIVRVPRGSVLIATSRFMPPEMAGSILDSGVSDYETVLRLRESNGTFSKGSAHQRGELLTGLAEGWTRLGNTDQGRAYFDRIVKELRGTVYEQRASAWLAGKPETKAPGFFKCTGCHVE